MIKPTYKTTKFACYTAYFTISSAFCVPSILFVTFRELYGISYTLLGTLVLVNFCTQLTVDLIFTFFTKYFSTKLAIRFMPIITSVGLLVYAAGPTLFPSFAYLGLLLGTVIFSVSAGLAEVLVSPVIAAIPSDNPGRDMSTLHSLYAFGVFTMVIVSTTFLKFFGHENWNILVTFLAILPLISAVIFMISPMPDMSLNQAENTKSGRSRERTIGLALSVACIFCGSCAENVMASWLSSYMERTLGMDKVLGDVFGVAMFAVLLGLGRILYARFGQNVFRIILVGMIGSAICYITVGVSSNVIVAFAACIFTGLCTAMLWPGNLIMMEENIPGVEVSAYALMAAGGDLGASLAPQLMGIVIDKVSASDMAHSISTVFNLTEEQVGMKAGMLLTSVFPIIGIAVLCILVRFYKKDSIKK
jgi:fucose permease